MRLKAGDPAGLFKMEDMFGEMIDLEQYRGKKIMISFYRYASCPFCNFRVHDLIQKYPDFQKQGLEMIAFFQSPKKSMINYLQEQEAPFPMIPDPKHTIYKVYGVTGSTCKFLLGGLKVGRLINAMRKGFMPGKMEGDITMVPGDFLINEDMTIHTAYYGKDISDHLDMNIIEKFLKGNGPIE